MTDILDPRPSSSAAGSLDPASAPSTVSDALADLDGGAWSALERIGRSLHVTEAGLRPTLEAVLGSAIGLVGATTAAGVNLYIRGKFEPQAVFGEAPHRLDALQQRTGSGPCIDASRDQTLIHVEDMNAERRWPEFAGLATSLGVLSMLCVPMTIDNVRLGSLSLYGSGPNGYHEHELHIASLLATHAAVAIADALREEHLTRAIANRDVIGQAKGILMERHRITADEAFALLTRASQTCNRKLADVAEELTATGALPAS
jgi:GAF domain-containing protein